MKLALRPHALGASRPRRQGSVDNGPARITGPALTSLPARQARRSQCVLVEAQGVVCSKHRGKRKNCSKYSKLVLDKAGTVRDGSGVGDWIDGGGRCPAKENGPTPPGRLRSFRQPGRAKLNSAQEG